MTAQTMTEPTITQERTQLQYWLGELPTRQFKLVYTLVEELIGEKQDTTAYLLSSDEMRERILAARESDEGIPIFTPLNQELAASQLQQFIDQQPAQ